LNLVALWGLVESAEQITIRVPLGLPDPTPLIPAANPPTLGKWTLGKKIFHAPLLKASGDVYACATCHDPAHGFTQPIARTVGASFNAPSLLNVVYRRQLFWDGRVGQLEETIVRSLEDERPPSEPLRRDASPLVTHRWGGLVNALDRDPEMKAAFAREFGVSMPTQDTIAKSLATYLRTLLSGDSLVDRAEFEAKGANALNAEHFEVVLTKQALAQLKQTDKRPSDVAKSLAEGHRLFHGKAKCSQCHAGPLLADHDFHNLGFDEGSLSAPGKEAGRFAQVPIGLKEDRLIGAYRTASLRGLPRTAPYFHHGRHQTLRQVVIHYDRGIVAPYIGPHLAQILRDGDNAQSLHLTSEEIDALVLFLEALDGSPVSPMVRR
jgi:cytochrome c peroxidase